MSSAFKIDLLQRVGRFTGFEFFPVLRGGVAVQVGLATPQVAKAGTAYTLAVGECFADLNFSAVAGVTLTVPPDEELNWPIGGWVNLNQMGAGQVTVAAGAGVTVNSDGGLLALSAQYASAMLVKKAANSWLLVGSLA